MGCTSYLTVPHAIDSTIISQLPDRRILTAEPLHFLSSQTYESAESCWQGDLQSGFSDPLQVRISAILTRPLKERKTSVIPGNRTTLTKRLKSMLLTLHLSDTHAALKEEGKTSVAVEIPDFVFIYVNGNLSVKNWSRKVDDRTAWGFSNFFVKSLVKTRQPILSGKLQVEKRNAPFERLVIVRLS